jgi:Fic family protein
MNTTLFTERKTGDLVPITIPGGKDVAFIPAKLPPDWKFPSQMWPKLAEAKESLGRLDGISRILHNPELLLNPLKRSEAISSSRIEGTYATAQQLMLFELNPKETKSPSDRINAWREVYNYSLALQKGSELLSKMPFCLNLIRQLHYVLLSDVRGYLNRPGEFREHQVAIGSDRRFIPLPPGSLLSVLGELETYINSDENAYDPLVKAFLVHYQFETIHPFGDGNGRIGRVLLSLMIAHWCRHKLPILYLSHYFERYKDEYIAKLFNVSAKGDWNAWIDFCLTGAIRQANDAITRCEKLNEMKQEMTRRLNESKDKCNPRLYQIVENLFSSPFVQTSELARKYDVSYPTAKSDIGILMRLNILREVPKVKYKSYVSPEIFEVAYKSIDDPSQGL